MTYTILVCDEDIKYATNAINAEVHKDIFRELMIYQGAHGACKMFVAKITDKYLKSIKEL